MSDLYLALAIVGTFCFVLLAVYAVDAIVADRRRAVRLLEAQVAAGGEVGGSNLREQELAQPFTNRALVPVFGGAAKVARRLTPIDARDRLAKRLVLAGSPAGWDAERVMAFKVIGGVGGLVAGFLMVLAGWLGGLAGIVVIALLGFIGFIAPDSLLNGKIQTRQLEIRNALSDTLDLLTISV